MENRATVTPDFEDATVSYGLKELTLRFHNATMSSDFEAVTMIPNCEDATVTSDFESINCHPSLRTQSVMLLWGHKV